MKIIKKEIRSKDIPTGGVAFLSFWQNEVAQIPVEYMGSIEIEYDVQQDYDFHYVDVTISYTRPMTEEERAERDRKDILYRQEQDAREYRQFLALKEKFGC